MSVKPYDYYTTMKPLTKIQASKNYAFTVQMSNSGHYIRS